MPEKFNVEIFKQGNNKENVVNKSKTTGEPPLDVGNVSVFFAIKDAIASVGNYTIDSRFLMHPLRLKQFYLV